PPATTPIYTLSLHDALPISFRIGIEILAHGAVGIASREQAGNDDVGGLVVRDLVVENLNLIIRIDDHARPRRNARDWRAFMAEIDRKSTRLNSSHVKISYAV